MSKKAMSDVYESIIDPEARAALQTAVAEVRSLEGRVGADTIKLGQLIIEIKRVVTQNNALRCWSRFVRAELGMSTNTSSRLMKVARAFGGLDPSVAACFQRTALFELAGDYVTAEIRAEAVALASAGQFVNFPIVSDLLRKHAVVRTNKKLTPVEGIGMRALHVVRSALKRAFDRCEPSGRRQLAAELQKLVNELLCEAGSADDQAGREVRRLRTRTAAVASADVDASPFAGQPGPRVNVETWDEAAFAAGVPCGV
jgi:hypothetical protein